MHSQLDRDLPGGKCYPPFKQMDPERKIHTSPGLLDMTLLTRCSVSSSGKNRGLFWALKFQIELECENVDL